jgi:hypothetical protein
MFLDRNCDFRSKSEQLIIAWKFGKPFTEAATEPIHGHLSVSRPAGFIYLKKLMIPRA